MNSKSEVLGIPVDKLIVDRRVQRPLDPKKVEKIVNEFNFDALGIICVSHRADGSYSIIDGQHRVVALRQLDFQYSSIQCEVFTDLALADEAAMFRLRNNTTSVQYLDKFRVRVIESDPVALKIQEILSIYGWEIGATSKDRNDGRIASIQSFERIYQMDPGSDPTAAELMLRTITKAWGHSGHGVDGRIINGLGLFYVRYADEIDHDDLANRLAKLAGGPQALVGRARGFANMLGTHVKHAIAEIITEEYNKRRRSTQLPPWRTS